MNSLDQMNQRQTQWLAEKASAQFDENAIRFNEGDLLIGQFVSSGNDGADYIYNYRTHQFPQVNPKNGKRYNAFRYCPTRSGDTGIECPNCEQGHAEIKERMSMYFYVLYMLRKTYTPRQGQPQLQQTMHQGQTYFYEEINDFRMWENSSWRDSPWQDINTLNLMYKGEDPSGLSKFTFQLVATGQLMERRYKINPLPNTPGITPELYAQAKQQLEPIPALLRKEISTPVQQNPAAPATPQPVANGLGNLGGFAGVVNNTQLPPVASITPLSIPGNVAQMPTLSIPTVVEKPTAISAPPPPPPPTTPEPPQDLTTVPEEDPSRPMKKMF